MEIFAMPEAKSLQAIVLLLVALIFGGGGSGAGICNLIVQLAALGIIAFNCQAFADFFAQAPRVLTILVVAALLLPLLQSIPLPPFVWRNLPGRELVTESLELVGRESSWFPVSLNVQRTVIAFLSLMPPLALLILTWKLPPSEQYRLLLLVVLSGIIVTLLGAQQLATGNASLVLFDEAANSKDLQGTFANRNTAGLFLDIALCALVAALPKRNLSVTVLLGGAAVAALLLVGVILTRSRSSMALILVPTAFFMIRLASSRVTDKMSWRFVAGMIFGFAILAGGATIVANENQRIQQSLFRFDDLQDVRPLIWADTLQSIKRFWPIGSGIGTFDEVFQIDESLENLGPGRAARAHNDYLESCLESGLAGAILLIGWAFFITKAALGAARRGGLRAAPLAVFSLLGLQSLLDYPLRNQTLLCVTGLMVAFLIPKPTATQRQGSAVVRNDTGS